MRTLRNYFEATDNLFTNLNLPVPIVKIKGNSNFSSFGNTLYRINVKMYGSIFNLMPHLLIKRIISIGYFLPLEASYPTILKTLLFKVIHKYNIENMALIIRLVTINQWLSTGKKITLMQVWCKLYSPLWSIKKKTFRQLYNAYFFTF